MAGLGTIDIEKCISYSHDLVDVLKNKKDANNLMQSLEETEMLQSIGKADSSEVKSLLEDYKNKIDACQQMIDDAKDVIISDEVLNRLENQLEEEHQREHSLTKEIRCVEDQLGELECQKVQVEDRRKILKEIELDGLRVHLVQILARFRYSSINFAIEHFGFPIPKRLRRRFDSGVDSVGQRMLWFSVRRNLSLYASVTHILPKMDDPTKISGQIVATEKKSVENFDFGLSNASSLDICNSLWEMIHH